MKSLAREVTRTVSSHQGQMNSDPLCSFWIWRHKVQVPVNEAQKVQSNQPISLILFYKGLITANVGMKSKVRTLYQGNKGIISMLCDNGLEIISFVNGGCIWWSADSDRHTTGLSTGIRLGRANSNHTTHFGCARKTNAAAGSESLWCIFLLHSFTLQTVIMFIHCSLFIVHSLLVRKPRLYCSPLLPPLFWLYEPN